jgi:integrase
MGLSEHGGSRPSVAIQKICWYHCWYSGGGRKHDTNMLTEARVRSAKPGARPLKLSDAAGLHLLIQPNGSKLWRLAYRFAGKQKTLALGAYPIVSLADARSEKEQAKKLLTRGTDPSAQRRADRQVRKDSSFRAIAEELIAKLEREGRAQVTLIKKKWLLDFAFPAFGDRPIAQITALELLALLREIEGRGLYETAKRLRSTCGMVFRYAIATGRAERDPSLDLRGALTTHQVNHRSAIVDPASIGALLRAIDGFDGQPTTHAALRLAAYVFVRPGELRHAEWKEFDLDSAVWRISAEKTKMRRQHRVPLARQSLTILHDLQDITGGGRWLFPSVRTFARPISENTLNAALRRLGYASDAMSTHGFRAMAATRLNEMGRWNSDAIERQLAHQEANAVRRAYTHNAEYWSERVSMMQAWADYLDELREGGKVLPLPHRAKTL